MTNAIKNTFLSVTGSSLTTIAGFLVLCTMSLTLGRDLGIVMAKGVLLGVITVLTLFPSLLLVFDKVIEKTKHKALNLKFDKLNKFIVKNHILIIVIFAILIAPMYLAYSKVNVYYKLDRSLPNTLESIKTNEILKNDYNIVSPEIILLDRNLKTNEVNNMIDKLENVDGIDFVLSYSKIKSLGITENMLGKDITSIFENNKYQMILVNSTYDIATDELNDQITEVKNIVKEYDKDAIVAGEGPLMKDLIEISDTDFNNVNTSSIICIFIILIIVLKSLSLPILLISAIEFAIFTNMGVSYFSGTILPFIAPIVLGTIQLGATIDYAILMTTTYLNKRNIGIKKEDAMLDTLNYTGNSIFVSAMCFFAATFGVGIYSKIEMIGSLCTLISRGAIISMIVVITVLPSILLIFDKLIIKTTKKNKEEIKVKNKVKKTVKKVSCLLLAIMFLVTSTPVYALTKDETVYSKLNYDGTIKNVIVNEELNNDNNSETIEDYSELNNIININSDKKYINNNNNLIWNANGENIFYQGLTTKKLPLDVNITYKLNGKEYKLDEIVGKKGKVSIIIKYKNNDKHVTLVNNKYETLYTPFVVTFGTVISNENNSNISITNGKVINNGTSNIVVGLATPGLYESLDLAELKNMDTIEITYDTKKFELSSMYSVVSSKLIDSSDLKIFDKMDSLYSKVTELQTNMNTIDDGAKQLSLGTTELQTKLSESIKLLTSNSNKDALTNEQIEQIKNKTVNNIKSTFTTDYKNEIASKAWTEVANNMDPNDSNVKKIVTDAVSGAVVEYLNSVNEYNAYISCETAKVIMTKGGTPTQEQVNDCTTITNDTVLPLIIKAATTSASTTASKTSMYVAENVSKEVSVNTALSSAIQTATGVSTTLSKEVANEVKNASISTLSSSLSTLYSGVEKINQGTNTLSAGITKFNNEGITKITSLLNTNVKSISEKIKVLNELGNNYQSFGSKLSNTNGSTKFVLVVGSKKVSKTIKKTKEVKSKENIWTRTTNLFK